MEAIISTLRPAQPKKAIRMQEDHRRKGNRKTRKETVIGALIKERRTTLGLTQLDLAKQMGLDYVSLISQIENGYIPVPASMWQGLANSLGFGDEEWTLLCLKEYFPEVYTALFGESSFATVAKYLPEIRTRN